MAGRIRLGFVLASPRTRPLASTRTSVLNMLPYLERAGFDASIVFEPLVPAEVPDVTGVAERMIRERCGIAYFQKVHGASVAREVDALATAGIRTVFGICDRVDLPMVRATDLTITVTEFLKALHPSDVRDRIRVVHDGIERPDVAGRDATRHRGTRARPLSLVLVTSGRLDHLPVLDGIPAWAELTVVGDYRESPRFADRIRQDCAIVASAGNGMRRRARVLRFVSHPRVRRVAWHADGVYDALLAADIAILPIARKMDGDGAIGVPVWQIKSENRLTMKMAAGLPVVATPIPSYLPVVEDGENALFARDAAQWSAALDHLRSPDERRRIGRNARESVLAPYSKDAQAKRLIEALRWVMDSAPSRR
ncbi:MAG TPA: glycosyltransferase [Casimicrobiaceae bacterium]|nr:glycosyltransferase [Casimicrobiaceae bacterium]